MPFGKTLQVESTVLVPFGRGKKRKKKKEEIMHISCPST